MVQYTTLAARELVEKTCPSHGIRSYHSTAAAPAIPAAGTTTQAIHLRHRTSATATPHAAAIQPPPLALIMSIQRKARPNDSANTRSRPRSLKTATPNNAGITTASSAPRLLN